MSERLLPRAELKCGCGASLQIEDVQETVGCYLNLAALKEIILAWIAAHKAHHEDWERGARSKKNAQPGDAEVTACGVCGGAMHGDECGACVQRITGREGRRK